MRRQLARVTRDGYATTAEEMTLGACSIAVPITSHDRVFASLGIVLPTSNRNPRRLVTVLQMASRGIARALE